MRKGKLLIREKSSISEREVCFDRVNKCPVEVISENVGNYTIVHKLTRIVSQIFHIDFDITSFVDLFIEDEITGEIFPLEVTQQTYIFSNENRNHLKFFTHFNGSKNIATVLSKDMIMQSMVNHFSPIGDSYGIYVAQQKSINEPAKNFGDWYFSVSV